MTWPAGAFDVHLYSAHLLCFEPKGSCLLIKSLFLYLCYRKHTKFFWGKGLSFKFCLHFGKVPEYLRILLLLLLTDSCCPCVLQLYSSRHPCIAASRERRGKSQPTQNPIISDSERLESFIK